MKKQSYIIALLAGIFALASCQDGNWDIPEGIPYGNNSLEAGTTVTIAELQSTYANVISSDNYKQITEDLWLRCVVNGNDYGDNLYKQLSSTSRTSISAVMAIWHRSAVSTMEVLDEWNLPNGNSMFVSSWTICPRLRLSAL